MGSKRQDPEWRKEMGRRNSGARGGVSKVERRRAACGVTFEHVSWMKRKTCSEGCFRELKRRQALERAPSRRPEVRKKPSKKARERSPKRRRDSMGRYA